MKTIIIIAIFFISTTSYAQENDYDLKHQILTGVFKTNEIKNIENQKVFETTIWGKHATIPFNNCHPLVVNEGLAAMAFEIFLADDPADYERMIKTGINNLFEGEGFKGGDQRLVQVIYYDIDNNKFLGKAKGFPLKEYPWIQDNIESWSDMTLIIDFSNVHIPHDICKLTIYESLDNLEGLGGKHYVFKYNYNEILTSKAIEGCYESIYKENNSLIIKIITNCEEHHYDGEPKQIKEVLLFKW